MKNLLERVAAHSKNQAISKKGAVKIFIIANRIQIQKTLDHGHDVKTIWATLKEEGRIHCTYSHFCQMINKHLG
jgi:hypothetical protein